jgi:myo-inositol-1(or 4)-monophosphatase
MSKMNTKNQTNYQELCMAVVELSKTIGQWMLAERKQFSAHSIETKSFNNLVSYVDKTAERMFIEGLTRILPGSGIVGEEGIGNKKGDYFNWIIDPLDGTTNYLHNLPIYCTSVALLAEHELVLGVVYEPNRDECFYTSKNQPSYLNGEIINVSTSSSIQDSLIATGFPYDDFGRKDAYIGVLAELFGNTRGVRRLGAAALDLCYVASGRFDAFFEYALSPWDVAAGAIIIQQAGGKVSEFNGQENFIFGKDIIAGNPIVHGELMTILDKHF